MTAEEITAGHRPVLEPPWVPQACTLPSAEQPLRVAEFDTLFAAALRGVDRVAPTELRLVLDGAAGFETFARDLTARETQCCSFFTFTFSRAEDRLLLDVQVPIAQVAVLDALADRAAAAGGGSR